MDFDKYYEILEKGGKGSGKKGHTTQAHLEQLKGKMGRHHIMQHGDKGSAFSTADRQGKSEVFHHEPTNSYHVVTEGGGVKELSGHENFKRLGAPYKGDPAAEGNRASREDASGTRDEAHDLMSQMKAPGVGKMAKGGPGSGKKGHKSSGKVEPKHFEPNPNLRDKNKDLDRITPEQSAERKIKKEEAVQQRRKDNRRANTEKYLKQLKTSLSLESDPAAKADFEKDIKDIEAELKLKKAGEGSRGGKVVGHTASGKPIYQGARDQKHSSFDKRDHLDSANHKYKLAEEYSKKLQDKIKGDPKFEGEKANKVRTFIKDTHEQAGHHQRIANSKGDHEESRMTTGGSLPASAISPKHAKALAAIKELRAKGDNETAKKVYNAYIRDNE